MAWSIGRYFYRQMSRRTKERGCTRKMAEHNIVTQNRPVTCGSKNLKRENWVFGAHPFGRKETKTRILFITLDHDPLCSNYFKTLKMINKRKFLSKQQISGQGQRKNKIFFSRMKCPLPRRLTLTCLGMKRNHLFLLVPHLTNTLLDRVK